MLKKSPTKSPTLSVIYRVPRRYKLYVCNKEDDLPEDQVFRINSARSSFPLLWLDLSRGNPYIKPAKDDEAYFEELTLDDETLFQLELAAPTLKTEGTDANNKARQLAEEYGFLGLRNFFDSDGRGEPVEVWRAISKSIQLVGDISDVLRQYEDGNAPELRDQLAKFKKHAGEHPGMLHWSSQLDDLDSITTKNLSKFALTAVSHWLQALARETSVTTGQNFEVIVRPLSGGEGLETVIVARTFLTALSVLLAKRLSGESRVQHCANAECRLVFLKTRKNTIYAGVDKKACSTYAARGQPCPFGRAKVK